MKARKPCRGCGASVNTLVASEPMCRKCRTAAREERDRVAAERSAEVVDNSRIDYAAVEWVIQGDSVDGLNVAGRKLVIRRMASRLASTAEYAAGMAPGKLTATQLGARMGISADAVRQTLVSLPAATRRRCPACRGDMWVIDATGAVEDHGNGFLVRCEMSGQPADVAVSA